MPIDSTASPAARRAGPARAFPNRVRRGALRPSKPDRASRSEALQHPGDQIGRPKLLDFGIAKLLDDRQAGRHTLAVTHADIRIMTPDHASPEQVRGQAITTVSDVYVLGVLLYKLLAGVGPFVIPSMRLTDIDRAICEKAPPLPSHAVDCGDSPRARAIAEARGMSGSRLRRSLQGDLDNIICMAMRKEPERRYGSAQQLAGDIQRYLDGKPVLARGDTLSYRSSKFIRRHWLPVAAGAGVFAMMLAFVVTTYVQSVRIAAERDRVAEQREAAEHERARAEEVSNFLVNLFKLSDPEVNRGNQVTARELLDSSTKRLQEALKDQPATKVGIALHGRRGVRQSRPIPGGRADSERIAGAAAGLQRQDPHRHVAGAGARPVLARRS